MSSAWIYRPATEIAAAVRARTVTARAVAEEHLARIARVDPELGSFLHVDAEGALRDADAVDAKLARGVDPGPLAGVPVALKDLFVTRGVPTTAASRILEGWIPPYDGTHVLRLREAGAVLLGKLNLDEFAMGSSNENSAYRTVRNPWDLTRVPGGSSGGSAAAVAAGLCAIALGTDTGGSIRQPASLCGVVGIKPTYGRVTRYGVIAFASSLDQVGPLARTTADCALALRVIAGHDPKDATSIDAPVPDYTDGLATATVENLRIGVPAAFFETEGLDPAVARPVRAALAHLESLGATLVPVELPHSKHAIATYYLVAPAEASSNLARYDGVRYGLRVADPDLNTQYAKTRAAGFGDEVKRRIMLGTYALRAGYYDAYYLRALKLRTLITRDFERAFATCDVIATPTSPILPFRLGEKSQDPLAMYLADVYTISANLAGIPGLSIPCGFTKATDDQGNGDPRDLPIGLQLLAPALEEHRLLRAAAAYERVTSWHQRHPDLSRVGEGGGAA